MKQMTPQAIYAANSRSVSLKKLLEIHYIAKPYVDSTVYLPGDIASYGGGTYSAVVRASGVAPPHDGVWVQISNPLMVTDDKLETTFEGHTFVPGVFKLGDITHGSDGKINPVTLTIGNVDEDRMVQRLIEDQTVIGQKFRAITLITGAVEVISDITFVATGAKAKKGQIDFTLSLGFDFLLKSIPGRTLRSKFCTWQFRDANCKYSGPDTDCALSWEACRAKFNTINFGGFPGIPSTRFYF